MIRVAIVDDHAVVRAGLRRLLADQVDLVVSAEASSLEEALPMARGASLDVLLLEPAMAHLGGVDLLRSLRQQVPDLPVLIFSGLPEKHYAAPLLRDGASGYLGKGCEPAELVQAIRSVHLGHAYAKGAHRAPEGVPHERLSEREFEVFMRLAGGVPLSRVAQDMGLSVKTVSTYRTRLMSKLELRSNSELTYYALRRGLLQ